MDERGPISFGGFLLDARDARLTGPSGPVHVGNKALSVLQALIDADGRLLTKDALFDTVWDGTIVSESALTSVIKELRRALGDDSKPARFIESVYGRGYRFVAPVDTGAGTEPTAVGTATLGNLPSGIGALIGRCAEVEMVTARLRRGVCLAIVGPGGVGKTQLAIEAARHGLADYQDGVWLVELAALTAAAQLPEAVAKALGLELPVLGETIPALTDRLRRRDCLILLDNAEHLVDAVAELVNAIRLTAPSITLLLTSQEPLGVAGEEVFRLAPLPPEDACALFIARAHAADQQFAVDETTAATIATICERLDGMPLAIEMAAARSPSLGCPTILARLDDRFRLLSSALRSTNARQQTLHATLEWSHGLLSARDATVFRRLGVFGTCFSLDAASAIASDAELAPADVEDAVVSLVAKSLLVARPYGGVPRFQLLQTMASFARAKLSEAGEEPGLRRRHAEWFAEFAAPIWDVFVGTASDAELLQLYRMELDDIEDATRWAYGAGGDPEIGHRLVTGSACLWDDRLLRRQVEVALERVGPNTPAYIRARLLGSRAHATMRLDPALAVGLADEAVRATRETTNDAWMLADVMSSKGFALWFTGRTAEAKAVSQEIDRVVPLDRPSRIGALANGLAACIRLTEAGPGAARPLFQKAVTALRSIGAHGLANFWQSTAMRFDTDEDLDGQIAAWRALLARITPGEMYADQLTSVIAIELAMRLALRGIADDLDEAMRIAGHFFRTSAIALEYRFLLPMALVALKAGRVAEGAIVYGFAEAERKQAGEAAMTAHDFDRVRGLVETMLDPARAEQLISLGATLPHEKIVELALGRTMTPVDELAA